MAEETIRIVTVDGQDISSRLNPVLMSLSVTDKEGTGSDTCELEIDATDGRVIMPKTGAKIVIVLGLKGGAVGEVFNGTVDEVRGKGSRGSGRTLTISGKGVDTNSKAKQHQTRHMDNTTVQNALRTAGQAAGITDIRVDPELASITRDYFSMDAESFLHFGQRIADEVGGIFKISGNRAVLALEGSGRSPGGATLPTVTATWGENLMDFDISPEMGRPRFRETRGRYYDTAAARWRDVRVQVENDAGATATATTRRTHANRGEAQRTARRGAKKAEKNKGGGSVTINGNVAAKPGGSCQVVGAMPGVDGTYKIESVTHSYSRSAGFTTKLELKQPSGGAGTDSRRTAASRAATGSSTPAAPAATGGGASP